MKSNPERLAWTVLIVSFSLFVLLLGALPFGVRWLLVTATQENEARLETLRGTVIVEDPRSGVARAVRKGESVIVPQGSMINVDETARANISFFDDSLVVLYPDSRLSLDQMYGPRFGFGSASRTVVLNHRGGGIRINTALAPDIPLHFEVRSPHLGAVTVLQDDGSYTIQVNNDRAEITVQRGQAQVTAKGVMVVVGARERTSVPVGEAPQPPVPAARDLVVNGDFRMPIDVGWEVYNDQGADGGNVDGQVVLTQSEGRRAVQFTRSEGQFNHCETVLKQEIDYEMPEPPSFLQVKAVVKVDFQSLSGGGYQSSEYPLMIRLTYQDAYGSQAEWVQGFYYQNEDNNPVMYGQQIPQGQWYLFESDNILPNLPIVPTRLVSLRVYASGWNYASMVSEVSLIIE